MFKFVDIKPQIKYAYPIRVIPPSISCRNPLSWFYSLFPRHKICQHLRQIFERETLLFHIHKNPKQVTNAMLTFAKVPWCSVSVYWARVLLARTFNRVMIVPSAGPGAHCIHHPTQNSGSFPAGEEIGRKEGFLYILYVYIYLMPSSLKYL